MVASASQIRELLTKGDFRSLFLEHLGWDNAAGTRTLAVRGEVFELRVIAQKRGVQVFLCSPGASGQIPQSDVRVAIDREVVKHAREHLLVFLDVTGTEQLWVYPRRELGRPTRLITYRFDQNASNELLLQKLKSIRFALSDEEGLDLFLVTERLKDSLDRDSLTKSFYQRFAREREVFQRLIGGIPDDDLTQWYVAVLVNRLMFIYFIQGKGFVNDDQHYLQDRLRGFHGDYYRDFLCPLFFQGFALPEADRPVQVSEVLGRIPYLNGGIFQKHRIEELCGNTINIPNKAFEGLFAFFDEYRWHLDERPLAEGNEINPDVLGYIFEKYVNQKQMGAYYTKEDITEYISRNTVIPFVLHAARSGCRVAFDNPDGPTVWDLLKEAPDRYIYSAVRHGTSEPLPDDVAVGLSPPTLHQQVSPDAVETLRLRKAWNRSASEQYALPTETWREVVTRRARCEETRSKLSAGQVRDVGDLITLNLDICQFAQDAIESCEGPDLLRAFWHAIEKVTVLDPTCGSGAFLFAALNILEPLYEACLDRMEALIEDLDHHGEKLAPEKLSDLRKVLARVAAHPNRRYFILKSVILNNLFGVDIMEEAVEICKLRLFLKLAAQVEPNSQHPNLGVEPLPDIDFNIKAGNTLVGFATYGDVEKAVLGDQQGKIDVFDDMGTIAAKAEELQQAFDAFRDCQVEGEGLALTGQKLDLNKRLKQLQDVLNRYLAATYGVDFAEPRTLAKWLGTHQPFHWFVEYYGIMDRGGFDVIVGNPPYVEYEQVRNDYKVAGYLTEECGNLFAFTWERSIFLANKQGRIGLIIPVSSTCADGYARLRELWFASGDLIVSNFSDRPGRLFDGIEHCRLAIVLLLKAETSQRRVFATAYNKWRTEARDSLLQTLCFADASSLLATGLIPKVGSPLEISALSKVPNNVRTLAHFVSPAGKGRICYTRKLSSFVQILDFVPTITDGLGRRRDPSELKQVLLDTKDLADTFLATLNSTWFYWLLTLWSDCRNLNKREVLGVPLDPYSLSPESLRALTHHAGQLMKDLREKSAMMEIRYKKWGTMNIQCIYPKLSKPLIDEIDHLLALHHGFSEEELDFIINCDFKYRMGSDAEDEEQ